IGALMVPVVYMSIHWWESNLHPVIGEDMDGGKSSALEPSMLFTLIFTVFTMTLVYIIFMQKGLYIEKLKLHVSKLKAKVNESIGGYREGKIITSLFSAYSIIWLLIIGYVVFLGKRQKQIIQEVKFLQDFLEK